MSLTSPHSRYETVHMSLINPRSRYQRLSEGTTEPFEDREELVEDEPPTPWGVGTSQTSLIKKSQSNEANSNNRRDLPFTRIQSDWWTRQMLVDRSLRAMAALTTLFAVACLIVVLSSARPFIDRLNPYSTSIGGKIQSCNTVKTVNMVLLFIINIAATMILGMSNTYQQMVAAIKVEDLRYALEKFGDSRVGTNSPFTINHKRAGKLRSWMCWLLLIVTSMPIHLLVNSLIGPSYIYDMDVKVDLNQTSSTGSEDYPYYYDSTDRTACYDAFRMGGLGQALFGSSEEQFSDLTRDWPQYDWSTDYSGFGGFQSLLAPGQVQQPYKMVMNYDDDCKDFFGQTTSWDDMGQSDISCKTGDVQCSWGDVGDTQCRLNIRLLAVMILTVTLAIKAIYMITVNVHARGSVKTTCLTFGDILVAAAADPSLRTYNECMVNASDHYRYLVAHSCHKHCTDTSESKTGDELGHCQKCKKFNRINKSPNLEQPRTATKVKKSLVSLLGGTTLPQLLLLSMCSALCFSFAVMFATDVSSQISSINRSCFGGGSGDSPLCAMTQWQKFKHVSGGWESRVITTFAPDSITNEFLAMIIANSPQTFYSFIYLLLIYNISLVSQEHAWGQLEHKRGRLRCTIDRGHKFEESYLIQLPKKVLFPVMAYSILIHWLLGECIQMREYVFKAANPPSERSYYAITYALLPLWLTTAMILIMTGVCWWAFSFKRQGFIPQMYGSVRVCCAAATELNGFSEEGVMWGDLGEGKKFRHAGFSCSEVGGIRAHELYAGRGDGLRNRGTSKSEMKGVSSYTNG